MKFPALKKEKQKVYKLPYLLGGINKTAPMEDILDTELVDALNVWNVNNTLTTRPGLYAELDNVLTDDTMKYLYAKSFFVTDTKYIFEGQTYNIAYCIGYGDSAIFVFVFLVNDERVVKNIGRMEFFRTSNESFYVPKKICFFVAEKKMGAGIYALVHKENIAGEGEDGMIYEANANLDGWLHNYDYYIPTILINGRGNAYETARKEALVELKMPRNIEAQNILSSGFFSYYTSDGYSSNFRLPFSKIANGTIMVRVYNSLESYTEWTMYGDENWTIQNFMGKEVIVSADREKGVIYFTEGGSEYKVPRFDIYSENNIRIFANKEISNGFLDITSCKYSAELDSRILFSGGNNKGRVYSCHRENPLYFPLNFENEIGSSNDDVTALKTVKNKLFIFKENELFTLKIKKGKTVSDTDLLAGEDKVFFNKDGFDIECVSSSCGTLNKNSVVVCNDFPVWLSADGFVYAYKNSVFKLTEKIDAISKENMLASVCGRLGKFYVLCYGQKIILINYVDASLYFWEFPQEVDIVGVITGNTTAFVMLNKQNDICFLASLWGDEDIIISSALSSFITLPFDIESLIKTKNYFLSNLESKLHINKVCLRLKAFGDSDVILNCNDGICGEYHFEESDFSMKSGDYIKVIPSLPSVNSVGITISSRKRICLESGEIYFNN